MLGVLYAGTISSTFKTMSQRDDYDVVMGRERWGARSFGNWAGPYSEMCVVLLCVAVHYAGL